MYNRDLETLWQDSDSSYMCDKYRQQQSQNEVLIEELSSCTKEVMRSKDEVIKAWGEAEKRIGKFVNLDEETLQSLMRCPIDLFTSTLRSELSKR